MQQSNRDATSLGSHYDELLARVEAALARSVQVRRKVEDLLGERRQAELRALKPHDRRRTG